MNPISLIQDLVVRTGKSQKALALEWLDVWNKTAAKPLAVATAQPRFSNLVQDELDGWKFFFGSSQRADVLLTLLGADEAERRLLNDGAAIKLAAQVDARVVVDLHDLEGAIDALLTSLVGDVLNDAGGAVLVLVNPSQYGQVPLAFTAQVRLAQVDGDEAAAREVDQRPEALILSARPPCDVDHGGGPACSRWAALGITGGRLIVEPPDALVTFAAVGHLPELPSVAPSHRLDPLGVAARPPERLLVGPELRRRLFALASGALDAPAEVRLGEANAYGIVAAATDAEWVQGALVAGGLPAVEDVDRAGLERALELAALRPSAPRVLRCGDEWHVVAADVPVALRDVVTVLGHRFEVRPTALRRLYAAIATRTAGEWAQDPYLLRAMQQVDPDGREKAALLHARAWLVYGEHCQVREDPPVADGLARLGRLLQGPPPPAEVRWTLPSGDGAVPARQPCVYVGVDPARLIDDAWAQVPLVGSTVWQRRGEALVGVAVDAPSSLSDFRTDGGYRNDSRDSAWDGAVWEGHLLVPSPAVLDDEAWLDAMAARGADRPIDRLRQRFEGVVEEEVYIEDGETGYGRREKVPQPARWPVGVERVGYDAPRWALRVQGLEDRQTATPWGELDAALVLAWAALGRALRQAAPLQVHDGRTLLPLGGGLVAEMTFRAAPPGSGLRAAFERRVLNGPKVAQRLLGGGWRTVELEFEPVGRANQSYGDSPARRASQSLALSDLFAPVYTGLVSSGHSVGVSLPAGLHLVGEGVACTIRFRADPYGLWSAGGLDDRPAVGGGALAAVEAWRQSRDD